MAGIRELQRLAEVQGLNMDWQTAPIVASSHMVKKILRLDIPKDSYPNQVVLSMMLMRHKVVVFLKMKLILKMRIKLIRQSVTYESIAEQPSWLQGRKLMNLGVH